MDSNEMSKRLSKNYGELYDAITDYLREYCLATHFPVKGNAYANEQIQFLLVGRALNGWSHHDDKFSGEFPFDNLPERVDYIERATSATSAKDRFNFLSRDTFSRSAFWRTAKKISEALIGVEESSHEVWREKIVWANLYPVAPCEGGNPSNRLIRKQRSIAKEILKETIELYEPTHILFETGWDYWMYYKDENNKYACMIDGIPESDIRKICDRKEIVLWYGRIGNSKIVIANRPELKNERKYVNAILEAFAKS